MGKRLTQEEFVEKAKNKHGEKCDYSLVEYVKSNLKVKFICNIHGIFETIPNTHLSSNHTGCMKCRHMMASIRQRQTKDHFLKRATEVHGDKYKYDMVEYKTVDQNVEILCPTHGAFWQRPDHHYSGSGCSSCQNFGYRPNLEGNFYILKCENIVKVGICNRDVKDRIRNISKSSGLNFKEYFSLCFYEGYTPLFIETEILKYLKNRYKSPEQTFDGSTECFYDVDILDLLGKIIELGEKYD